MTPIERGSTLIATKEIRFSGRRYRPGDKFDYRRAGIAHRRTIAQMLKSKKLDELTQASMATALRFRDPDAGPPRGFTLAGLKGLGILTEEQIAQRGWDKRNREIEITDESEAPEPMWEAPEGSWKVFGADADEANSTEENTAWVVPFQTGGAPRYFVHSLTGEKLSGEGSINGKAKAETWARDYLATIAASAAAKREGDPDWSKFPENEDDWTDAQVEEFDAWYDALQPGAEVDGVGHPAVIKLVTERRAAEEREAELKAQGEQSGEGEQTDAPEGLTETEMNELLEAMTDDELREHVHTLTGKDRDLLAELTPLALREMAMEHKAEGASNDGDVQSGAQD